ncbi:MAG: hypothetical protein N2596_08175 [Syntrophorhabdaceae bacterium]|nr:hypothetical protein [Syntrophorhabdaceae bacterium]
MKSTKDRLLEIFYTLLQSFGKRYWWPGESALEIIVGAVLTQNTAWKNVEKAINNLKREHLLTVEALYHIDTERLSNLIMPSGFFNIKTRRLKNLIKVLYEIYDASIENLEKIETYELRKTLIDINGIGKETADSILLYALNRPVFVVDAYTKRFLKNHTPPLIEEIDIKKDSYDTIQRFFMEHLPQDVYIYNEYHALIVYLCQKCCKKIPECEICPIKGI